MPSVVHKVWLDKGPDLRDLKQIALVQISFPLPCCLKTSQSWKVSASGDQIGEGEPSLSVVQSL